MKLHDLTITIEQTIKGTKVTDGLRLRRKPWTLTISWSPGNSRFYQTAVSRSDERPLMRTTVKDYRAAYRSASRAIEKIGDRAFQAALRRALNPTPVQRLEILGVYADGVGENVAFALYRWQFTGKTERNWDVDVDERFANRYHGIACYLHDLPRR